MPSASRRLLQSFSMIALLAGIGAGQAQAVTLLNGFGGPAGYGAQVMSPNDDQSSSLLNLPFALNFFGNSYSNFYVNNNGNITFNAPVWSYTPDPFPISSQPMIAPYWGDVDTRSNLSGQVYVAAPNANTVVVTWNNVGYYSYGTNKLNNFQLVLRNRADTGAGNFDVEFRYDRLEWTTGSASGGVNGLGGVQAQAGYDAGDGVNYFTLPGSRTAQVLDLADASNIDATTPGLWSFAIRDGELPGSTPDNPLMPVVADGSFSFDFNIGANTMIWIDPLIATGYDYIVDSGPNFASVLISDPLPNGDSLFDLIVNGLTYQLVAGTAFDFTALNPAGVSSFSIRGIDTAELLDPLDQTAFVTGVSFVSTGNVQMRQIPVSTLIGDPLTVPEPATLALLGAGAALIVRRRQARRG